MEIFTLTKMYVCTRFDFENSALEIDFMTRVDGMKLLIQYCYKLTRIQLIRFRFLTVDGKFNVIHVRIE